MNVIKKPLTYISLFSAAGIGCYGFKQENFECISTVEILEKRLKFQHINGKCKYESGYISDDIRRKEVRESIRQEIAKWKKIHKADLDVVIATPPCQGMSLANHKKGDEKGRNSLVVESISVVEELKPKFFVFENVRSFLTTLCTDTNGTERKIREVIELHLAGSYNILYKIINFKDYGSPSSRTRTLVLGVRKDVWEVTPLDIFPDLQKEQTLHKTIGHLPSLDWGEFDKNDIYHSFREYSPEMLTWIKDLKQGQSAFDNTDPEKIPHRKNNDGTITFNQNKNGDKYKRQYWNKVAPCVHTRNDILSSQNTVHPIDNRVFSIRELSLMMSIPPEFKFTTTPMETLNAMTAAEKKKFIYKEEMNIRQCLGEAVPTIIFKQIAEKIRKVLKKPVLNAQEVNKIIAEHDLSEPNNLAAFVITQGKKYSYPTLAKIAELANSVRNENAAYYTRQDICYTIIKDLPEMKSAKSLRILEPSIGVGNFLPLLFKKYKAIPKVIIDVVDIDNNSLETLNLLLKTSGNIPKNFRINYINADFLDHEFTETYDIVIGNPPYKKITGEKELLKKYKANIFNQDTNNIFSFFIEKALKLGKIVSLIVPKSLINSPEFNKTRELMAKYQFQKINDYGEEGFKGVKIETISFIIDTKAKLRKNHHLEVESYFLKKVYYQKQDYIFSKDFPYWLIYRDDFFDEVAGKLKFNIFKAYRDRVITKQITKPKGNIRVLKSRNIGSNEIRNIEGYDCFINDIGNLNVGKFLNNTEAVLVPNLTYSPRACFLPENTITDGSVAILTLRNGSRKIETDDLEYFATEEYKRFYAIARNHGTRSLNIDNNSVFFFGIRAN